MACDACEVFPIQGVMYECAVCDEYDLCESCKNKGVGCTMNPAHDLIRVTKEKAYHIGYACKECRVTPIPRIRYQCKVCPYYSLCGKCKQKGNYKDQWIKSDDNEEWTKSSHTDEHDMKEIAEDRKALKEVMIDPPRRIDVPNDFKIFGADNVELPCQKRYLLLKLQALIRRNMGEELDHLLNGVLYAEQSGEVLVLNADLNGMLQAKFGIPLKIRVGTNRTQGAALWKKARASCLTETPKSNLAEAELMVTPLQLAIIAKSSESIGTILKRLKMDDIIQALEEKVELKISESNNHSLRKNDLSLHGMNAFHLAAKYYPESIKTIHENAQKQIWGNAAEKTIPETIVNMYKIERAGGWSRKKTKVIGEKTNIIKDDPGEANELNRVGTDGFDEEEVTMVKRVTDQIQDEQFDRNDPFYVLQCQDESFRKRLVQLQLLLGRENCLKHTPLHTAIESKHKHLAAGVRLVSYLTISSLPAGHPKIKIV